MLARTKDIVIVDDNSVLLSVLSQIFIECGWNVRSASDGFTALSQVSTRAPEIILSDLNMAGMSGFEFLSIVRRRFPRIAVVAMSGAYSGSNVPRGVAADAFYAKGASSVGRLLDLVASLGTEEELLSSRQAVPIWVPTLRIKSSNPKALLVTCPECLRAFVHYVAKQESLQDEVCCWHCLRTFQLSIVNEPSGMDMSGLGVPHMDGPTVDCNRPCTIGVSSHEVRPNDQHHC
jgi:CheY-like chemotaxis protein